MRLHLTRSLSPSHFSCRMSQHGFDCACPEGDGVVLQNHPISWMGLRIPGVPLHVAGMPLFLKKSPATISWSRGTGSGRRRLRQGALCGISCMRSQHSKRDLSLLESPAVKRAQNSTSIVVPRLHTLAQKLVAIMSREPIHSFVKIHTSAA